MAIRFSLVALDCPDPWALAEFYAGLLGWELDPHSDDESDQWPTQHSVVQGKLSENASTGCPAGCFYRLRRYR